MRFALFGPHRRAYAPTGGSAPTREGWEGNGPTEGKGAGMNRIATAVAVAALAITLMVVSLLPAQANHNPAHTQRQITKLQNQITTLKGQVTSLRSDVRDLLADVFVCEFFDDSTPKTFPDGSIAYPLYYDSTCVA